MWFAHAGKVHQNDASTWWHAFFLDNYLFGIGLIVWLIFLMTLKFGLIDKKLSFYVALVFALANISSIFFIETSITQERMTVFMFLNGGFLLLLYTLFKDKLGCCRSPTKKASKRGE